jgi:hypothetical protein
VDPKTVLLVHHGRCGSKVLTGLLAQHPEVHWASEIYFTWGGRLTHDWRDQSVPIESVVYPGDAIELLNELREKTPAAIWGYEVQPSPDLIPMGIGVKEHITLSPATHLVCLHRLNLLRKIVSSLVAHATRRYHVPTGEPLQLVQITLDLERCMIKHTEKPLTRWLAFLGTEMDDVGRAFTTSGRPHLDLTYERDVQEDPVAAYRKLCTLLEIEPRPVRVQLANTDPFPLRDVLLNFDEVAARLTGTPWEWMLTG